MLTSGGEERSSEQELATVNGGDGGDSGDGEMASFTICGVAYVVAECVEFLAGELTMRTVGVASIVQWSGVAECVDGGECSSCAAIA